MKVVNSLIFNSLARRESVNIPEVGSLRVERQAARLKGKTRLELPVTRIVFSKNVTEGACSVIDLIERESGADRFKSEEFYSKWLDEITKEKTVTIEGVGRIKNDFFTPSPELAVLINPDESEAVKIKKRPRIGLIAAVVGSLAIVVGAGYYLVVEQGVFDFVTDRGQYATVVKNEIPAEPMIVLAPDTVLTESADSTPVATTSTPVDNVKPNPTSNASESSAGSTTTATTTATTPSTQSTSSSTLVSTATSTASSTSGSAKYHVIAGVYSTSQNAEKFIAKSRQKADTLPYKILPLSSGKFLVSVFEATTEEAASKRRAQLKRADPNLWVYKSAK